MNCPNCNAQIGDNVKFCPFCGTKIEAQPQTEEAVQLNNYPVQEITQEYEEPEPAVIPEQPAPIAQQPVTFEPATPVSIEIEEPIKKESKSKAKYIIIAAIVAVIAIAAVLLVIFLGGRGKSDDKVAPTLYETKNELYVIKSVGKKSESILISNNYAGSYLLSENYEYVIYTEDYSKSNGTRDIYFKKLMDEKAEPVLIAKDADYINRVIGNVDSIFYTKDNAIYVSDDEGNSEKLAKNASFENVSDDGKTLYYTISEEVEGEYDEYYEDYETSTLYTVYKMNVSNQETTELAKDVERTEWNKDYTKLYTLNSNKLACIDIATGKSTNIADKVESMSTADNTLYYSVTAKEYDYTAFVADSYADADSKLAYPDWEDYAPDWEDYAPDWDAYSDNDAYWDAYDAADAKYQADYDKADLAYDAAYDAYYEAEDRIYLREELKNSFTPREIYTLYRYDGTNSTAILENASEPYISRIYDISENAEPYNACSDKIVANQYKTSLDSFKKIDITAIESVSELEDLIDDAATDVRVIISGATVIPIDAGEDIYVNSLSYNSSTSEFYFIIENDDDDRELYSLAQLAKSFSDAKKIAGDVYTYSNVNGTFTYLDNMDEDSYECTANYGEEKINDVYIRLMTAKGVDGVLYFSDVDNDEGTASLYCYSKGKSTLICDDASSYFTVIDGKYVIITDYSYESGGNLVCIDGDETYDIDSRVMSISNNTVTFHSCDGNTTYYYE